MALTPDGSIGAASMRSAAVAVTRDAVTVEAQIVSVCVEIGVAKVPYGSRRRIVAVVTVKGMIIVAVPHVVLESAMMVLIGRAPVLVVLLGEKAKCE
jgi:hypothetical protein